jgi:hypothetical protein
MHLTALQPTLNGSGGNITQISNLAVCKLVLPDKEPKTFIR